jgi:hypothetical protein
VNIGQALDAIWTVAKTDELQVVVPAVVKFLQSVAANPTAINAVASFAQLQVTVLSSQPNIEQAVLQQLATTLAAAAGSLIAPAATIAAAAAKPVA